MHTAIHLTVAQSKRLIAKGIAAHPQVRQAMTTGIVAVAQGTTNGYVAEELLGRPIDKTRFVTGRTVPDNYSGPRPSSELTGFVFRNGESIESKAVDVIDDMRAGDVFIKGANALNYDLGQAGVLIGHPTGGTVDAILGRIVARRIRLIHPVGLEKNIPGDLHDAAALQKDPEGGKGPTLWVTPGEIFTEIEAFAVLTEVLAVPTAAGGIGGAEGAIWFDLHGNSALLDRATALVASLRDEPPFIPVDG